MDFKKKEVDLQDRVLGIKLIKKALDKRGCEEFEMALEHKTKLRVYRELKWEIGFEEYSEYVKVPPSRVFLKFCSGTHGLFEELGRHADRGGLQECSNCGACKESVEHVLSNVHYMIPRD